MENSRLKVTLDTNCLINVFDRTALSRPSFESLSQLFRLGLSGKAEIAATTRAEADLLNDRDPGRRDEMLAQLALIPIIGSVGRWGVSAWGSGDVFASPELSTKHEEVKRIVFPGLTESDKRYRNKLYDVDHLVGHALNKRDIFVTADKDILRRSDELRAGPGIVVMTPDQCVTYIESLVTSGPKPISTDGLNPRYHLSESLGRAQFDYSNNNGEFAIGEGPFLFRTEWSKASDISIHAYKDRIGIDALALVKDVSEINEIKTGSLYDFSSRVRTPRIGQIVIWRNTCALYAATKIIGIKDDKRSDDRDELIFDFVILHDGTADFSKAIPKLTQSSEADR